MTDFDNDDDLLVTVTEIRSPLGTIIVFLGTTEDDETVTFAVDHRMATPIIDHLLDPEQDEPPVASVPPWAILSLVSP
jgi:hypothetical protein